MSTQQYYPTTLDRECRWCTNQAAFLIVKPDGPEYGCRSCVRDYVDNDLDAPTKDEVWTVSTHSQNREDVTECICTYILDPDEDEGQQYCGDTAYVFVLRNGFWEYDCLCEVHGPPVSPDRLYHHREKTTGRV